MVMHGPVMGSVSAAKEIIMNRNVYVKQLVSLISVTLSLVLLTGTAIAQNNQIYNPGFEMGPTRNDGNLFMPSNQNNAIGWFDGGGNQLNVVQIDGAGGYNYGSFGPENDASGTATPQNKRRYLDIANGVNIVYQRIVPNCSGDASFGAWFSTRDNLSGRGSIRIIQGSNLNGSVVANSNNVSLPIGNSRTDPWVLTQGTVNLSAGTPYVFAISMDNNLNMDDAYLYFSDCATFPELPDVPNAEWPTTRPVIDPCCPPWNAEILGQSLLYRGAGAIGSNYTLEFDPAHTLNGHVSAIPVLQAYMNYVDLANPLVTQMVIQVSLHDQGTNQWPASHPNAVGQNYYATGFGPQIGPVAGIVITPGATSVAKHVNYVPATNIFVGTSGTNSTPAFPMQPGRWYLVHTGMWLDGGTFFDGSCSENDVFVRIDVLQRGSNPTLQFLTRAARTTTQKALDAAASQPAVRRM